MNKNIIGLALLANAFSNMNNMEIPRGSGIAYKKPLSNKQKKSRKKSKLARQSRKRNR